MVNYYAKFAKYGIAALWAIFILTSAFLALSHNLGFAVSWQPPALLLCIAVAFPCAVSFRYFHDAVSREIDRQGVLTSDEVRLRLAPLARYLDGGVQIGIYPSSEPNAFAISNVFGKRTLIAFSTALTERASDRELAAIAAHEIAHLRSGDAKSKAFILAFSDALYFYPHLISELSKSVLKGALLTLGLLAGLVLLLVIVFPEARGGFEGAGAGLARLLPLAAWPVGLIAAQYLLLNGLKGAYFAYSREREFAADRDGAAMTSPQEMIAALSLLTQEVEARISVFDTHPPLAERRRRLERIAVADVA
ncbi:M48 family metalloprotease [Pseudoduganella sp.]|uniref:M48 family metalloprotease n=1 Tax=Pseudoduganella sp. TaxID=1880898 RepID=UPI0035B4463C